MSEHTKPEVALEIGHVLFLDIVGYSKRSTHEQNAAICALNEAVSTSTEFQQADAADRLIKIPTGDGMALVFYTSPQSPARCAREVSRGLRAHNHLTVRMGIHSGSVSGVVDVTGHHNLAGAGLNIAQRVMDCGDAGHVLLSKHAADDLHEYDEWRPHLHDLGPCEVKHGVKVHIVNLCDTDFGNRILPTRFRAQKRRRAKRVWTGMAAAALILAAAATLPLLKTRHAETGVAVLPFRPLLSDQRDEVLEMGMADTLISKLSNTREMVVPSLTSVRRYAGVNQDAVAAGRDLGVSSVVEGNVQRVGDRIRVSVRLIRVANGASLWADTFEEKIAGVFEVQDRIAQKIVEALTLRLSGEGQRRLVKHYTENVEAYQLYLTGRNHWNKLIPPELAKSIEFFQKAVELDPNYALAYFGMADAYRALVITSDLPPKEVFPQAKAAAQKAIEIDGSLAEPHATLALVHMWFDWDWAAAEREAQHAIRLNPNLGFSHWAYAHVLSNLGRHEEAITQAVRARELDPLSLIANAREGAVFYYAERYDRAKISLEKTVTIDPTFWIAHLFLGYLQLQTGDHEKAAAEFAKAKEFSKGNSEATAMTGYIAARKGETAKARAVLDELNSRSAQGYVPPHSVAIVYIGMGENEQALAWLEKSYQERDVRLSFLKIDSKWDPLRSDPRFISLLKRINLQ
jgi:TolB-like protein/Tfp pilus assembly protein PilF/class 3 adenylate cyclase